MCQSKKTAKEFLRKKFQNRYASQVNSQLAAGSSNDMALSIVKPLGARWLCDLYDYILARPKIIINSFRLAGLLD